MGGTTAAIVVVVVAFEVADEDPPVPVPVPLPPPAVVRLVRPPDPLLDVVVVLLL